MKLPTLEIESAATLVHGVMRATARSCWPLLRECVGPQLWVKQEIHTALGAFRIRGGLIYLPIFWRVTALA